MNTQVSSADGTLQGDRYENLSARYYALGALTIAYVFNFVDRQMLAILQEPIKHDLGLSDTQLGLLTGFAFALFYVVMGLPIARLADKKNRRNIIAWSVGVWSAFSAACGMAGNFFQLLLARVGVGVGEAGCSPPAHSMISDIFPSSERATALGIYSTGINIGVLFGFLAGGWLNQYFGWRVAFLAVAIPGILLALIIRSTVSEPVRGRFDLNREDEVNSQLTEKDALAFLWARKTFRHMVFGASLLCFVGYGLLNWLPSFFIRSHDLGTGVIGTWLALILGVGGGLGTLLVGVLTDKMGRRDSRWYLWLPALLIGFSIPLIFAMLWLSQSTMALICYIVPGVFLSSYMAPLFAITHGLVESHMRAFSSAIVFLILNLVGMGLGPLSVGLMSDFLSGTHGVESLRYALLWLMPAATLWGVVHFFQAAKSVREELDSEVGR